MSFNHPFPRRVLLSSLGVSRTKWKYIHQFCTPLPSTLSYCSPIPNKTARYLLYFPMWFEFHLFFSSTQRDGRSKPQHLPSLYIYILLYSYWKYQEMSFHFIISLFPLSSILLCICLVIQKGKFFFLRARTCTHKDVIIIPGSSTENFVSKMDSSHIRCT